MPKIMIYFTNGNRARFDPDKVFIYNPESTDGAIFTVHGDKSSKNSSDYTDETLEMNEALVNWGNVCFLKLIDDEED